MNAAAGSRSETTFWGKRFLIIVTGASGGIGRGIAVNFAQHVAGGSLLVLTGRNTAALEETKRMIAALARDVNVSVETCDHSTASFGDYQDLLRRASTQVANPDRVLLVHNVASLVSASDYVVSYDSERKIDDYFRLNLTSVMTLTAAFLRQYDSDSGPSRMIVNISAGAAIRAGKGVGLYCTGKAAREMYMKVVATENPSVTVLNYVPGVVDTPMTRQALEESEEFPAIYKDLLQNGQILTPDTNANLLIRILECGNFKSGEHVDYKDAP